MLTYPELFAIHNHISEREGAHIWPDGQQDDSRWEDCTPVATLMWVRLCFRPGAPATHSEAEAIRRVAGEDPLGGTSTDDMLRGIARRYGLTPTNSGFRQVWGTTALFSAMTDGIAAMVQGSMAAFADGHRLRRHDPGFDGAHAVLVVKVGDEWWWDDPLAADTGYRGEKVTTLELAAFANKFAGSHLVAPVIDKEKLMPQADITDRTPKTADFALGTDLMELDNVSKLRDLTIALNDRYSPYGVGTRRAIFVVQEDGSGTRLALATPIAGSVKDILDPSPYTQAQIDEEVDKVRQAYRARILNIRAKVAALAEDVAND